MKSDDEPTKVTPARSGRNELASALVSTTLIQLLATATVLSLTPIAPHAALDFGVDANVIGYQISLIYLAGALGSCVAGTLLLRHGAVRIEQMVLAFLSLGLIGLASANVALAVLASLFIGVAYGLQNPAASQILGRVSPPHRRNLVFSIKQAGVPLGGALASFALPLLDETMGWRYGLLVLAVLPLLLIWHLQSHVADENALLQPHAGSYLSGLIAEQKRVWGSPALRVLALVGLLFSSIQLCVSAFLVLMLVQEAHWSLIAAASVAGLVQISGAIGRLAWGQISDTTGSGMGVLLVIGLICTAAMLTMPMLAAMPAAVQIALLCALGACVSGWNGVAIAEMTRHCAPGEAGRVVGGTMVYTFVGVVLGPSSFALLATSSGDYRQTFAIFSIAAALAAILCGTQIVQHRSERTVKSRQHPERTAA